MASCHEWRPLGRCIRVAFPANVCRVRSRAVSTRQRSLRPMSVPPCSLGLKRSGSNVPVFQRSGDLCVTTPAPAPSLSLILLLRRRTTIGVGPSDALLGGAGPPVLSMQRYRPLYSVQQEVLIHCVMSDAVGAGKGGAPFRRLEFMSTARIHYPVVSRCRCDECQRELHQGGPCASRRSGASWSHAQLGNARAAGRPPSRAGIVVPVTRRLCAS